VTVIPDRASIDGSLHRLVAEDSPDLHTITTVDGVYRYVSPAVFAMFGWEPAELVGRHQDSFMHPDDAPLVERTRRAALKDPNGTLTNVFRFRCAGGAYRWTESLSRLIDTGPEPLVVSAIRDIGDRKKTELDLELKASTDPLTGVANRTVFMDRLRHALRRLERRDTLVAVLFLDLDRFKLINDSVGHLIGDAVLMKMAERLRAFLRPQDTLARWGGDEFAVVIEDLSWPEEAVVLGERIIQAGRAPFLVGSERFICTTSVGIAVTRDSRHSAEGLLQEADLALYRAKDRGRDRAEVFDEDLRTRAVDRLGTERMLRRAIDEDRLRVNYQPIIDLRSGATVAAEALVRVWDPNLPRLIEAETFIAVAEEAGLLAGMDDWVLGQTIDQATIWRELFVGTGFADVAINVTARHMADAGFAESVIDALGAHDLSTEALQIEVTEQVLMEASNSAMSGLKTLRDAGVKVGLDDFGTGYSSLSYLRMFPLDFVKIDRSFIRELVLGNTERAIVGSIIDLSHALGMAVVAEGVETQSQLDELMALGCDRAQGFLMATAGPPALIEDRVLRSGATASTTRGDLT
jgi:diguanylate cyclase (GGDEF)-like protein/PAS domain S-box-containing protein